MNRWAPLICIFILSPASGRAQTLTLFPAQSDENKSTVEVAGLQIFSMASNSQSGVQTQPVQTNSTPNRKHRLHLIELSAANWRPLAPSEKFELFWRDLLHWEPHASIAFDSGLAFATGDRPYLGDGASGYFTRYGLNVADEANTCFFTAFLFPSIFHQDPRYIPRDGGRASARLAYALSRVLVARGDSGRSELNANLLGGLFSTSISSAMYSSYGADIGVGGNFVAFGYNEATSAAFNVFKEFWPDVARKMKLSLWLRHIVRTSIRDSVRVG